MLDIEAINELGRDEFVAYLGPAFENSPWVAERVWNKRPFADRGALHEAMLGVIRSSEASAQVEFLCAHPDLAGREAMEGSMTAASTEEQGTAGLYSLSREEMALIDELNGKYRARHGFPFIICARHYTRLGIFAEFTDRVGRDTEAERAEALRQIANITRYRLSKLVCG